MLVYIFRTPRTRRQIIATNTINSRRKDVITCTKTWSEWCERIKTTRRYSTTKTRDRRWVFIFSKYSISLSLQPNTTSQLKFIRPTFESIVWSAARLYWGSFSCLLSTTSLDRLDNEVNFHLICLISFDLGAATDLQPRYKVTATVGLVVHAAGLCNFCIFSFQNLRLADGIALGAASSTSADIQMIVFLAIMLHKVCWNFWIFIKRSHLNFQAPSAFGLCTFLLYEGLEKARIRRHLLIFSLSAPLMALLTQAAISMVRLIYCFNEFCQPATFVFQS